MNKTVKKYETTFMMNGRKQVWISFHKREKSCLDYIVRKCIEEWDKLPNMNDGIFLCKEIN